MNTPPNTPTVTCTPGELALAQPLNSEGGLAPSAMIGGMQINLSAEDIVAVKAADVELKIKRELSAAQSLHTEIVRSIETLVARWDTAFASLVPPPAGFTRLNSVLASVRTFDPDITGKPEHRIYMPVRLSYSSDAGFNVPKPAALVGATITTRYTLQANNRDTGNSLSINTTEEEPITPVFLSLIDEARTLLTQLENATATIRSCRTRLSNIGAATRQARAALTRAAMAGSAAGTAWLRAMDTAAVDDATNL